MAEKPVRIIKHEAVPDCGSFEVKFADGRPSVYFYWDDQLSRKLRREVLTSAEAMSQAQELARSARAELETKKAADRA